MLFWIQKILQIQAKSYPDFALWLVSWAIGTLLSHTHLYFRRVHNSIHGNYTMRDGKNQQGGQKFFIFPLRSTLISWEFDTNCSDWMKFKKGAESYRRQNSCQEAGCSWFRVKMPFWRECKKRLNDSINWIICTLQNKKSKNIGHCLNIPSPYEYRLGILSTFW